MGEPISLELTSKRLEGDFDKFCVVFLLTFFNDCKGKIEKSNLIRVNAMRLRSPVK